MTVEPKMSNSTAVLYVEDDDLTRERISARLQRQGYQVLAAPSGEDALNGRGDRPGFHVVVLDLDLPGIDGVETWRRLRQRHPDLAGVVCSGALTDTTRRELQELGIRPDCCLCKPCRFNELLAALKRASNAESTSP